MKKISSVLIGLTILIASPTAFASCLPLNDANSHITTSGTYCVTNDMTQGIYIGASDVTIDFQGHVVKGPMHNAVPKLLNSSSQLYGLRVGNWPHNKNITFRNGTISGFRYGAGISTANLVIENMRFIDISAAGILFNGVSSAGVSTSGSVLIRDNTIQIDGKLELDESQGYSALGMRLLCGDPRSTIVSGNRITGLQTKVDQPPSIYAIDLNHCHNVTIDRNDIDTGDYLPWSSTYRSVAVYVYGAYDTFITNNKVRNFGSVIRNTGQADTVIAADNMMRSVDPNNYFSSNVIDGGGNKVF